MMKLLLALITAAILLISVQANAVAYREACQYAVYSPEAIFVKMRNELTERGISDLAPGEGPLGSSELASDRWNFLRGIGVVARMSYNENLVKGYSALSIYDTDDHILLLLKESTYKCPKENPVGICRIITLSTALESVSSPAQPYTMIQSDSGFEYLRYGNPVTAAVWRRNFRSTINHILDVVSKSSKTLPIAAQSIEASYFFTMAANAQLAPYVSQIEINYRNGVLHLTGRLPHGIYDRLISESIASGFTNINPNIIIDSAAWVLPPESVRLKACIK